MILIRMIRRALKTKASLRMQILVDYLGGAEGSRNDFLKSKFKFWAEDTLREVRPGADIYNVKSLDARKGEGSPKSQENFIFFNLDGTLNYLTMTQSKQVIFTRSEI